MDVLAKVFDPYTIQARVYPSILALLPLVGLLALFHLSILDTLQKTTVFAIVVLALAFLVSGIARELGRKYEVGFVDRHGWQTTVLLRHADGEIDVMTKQRYHSALGNLAGSALPSAADEKVSPQVADAAYRSATKKLIEGRRDDAFKVVHFENASYGFWRNLVALRPIAITLASVCLLVAAAIAVLSIGYFESAGAFLKHVRDVSPLAVGCMVGEAVYIGLFLGLVNERAVLNAARNFGHALLKTLDAPVSRKA